MPTTAPLSPQEKKEALKKRLRKVLPKLPKYVWMKVFVEAHPEYAAHKMLLQNVQRMKSLDEDVIAKLEKLAPRMKELAKKYL